MDNASISTMQRSTTPKRTARFGRNVKKYWGLYLMFLPVIICLVIFNYIPMWGVSLSFKDYLPWKGFAGSEWVGFRNFKYIFNTPDFPRLVRNTLLINLYKLFWGFPTPIIFALLLNEIRVRYFKQTVQTISYLPHFVSWIVISGITYNLFNTNYGILNNILKAIGQESIQWYIRSDLWRSILVITHIWKSVGYSSIIYLAAMAAIDPSLYEAAIVDGATKWQQIWNITIPSIMSTASILLIFEIGNFVHGNFEQTYALIGYNSPLYETTDVLDFFIYRVGLQGGQFSVGTALGLFQSAIGFGLVILSNYLAKKLGGQGIW